MFATNVLMKKSGKNKGDLGYSHSLMSFLLFRGDSKAKVERLSVRIIRLLVPTKGVSRSLPNIKNKADVIFSGIRYTAPY